MTTICRALAFLFALLVLTPAPAYDVQPGPASHHRNPAHTRPTP